MLTQKKRKQVTSHRSTYKVAGIRQFDFVSGVPRNSERD